MKWLKRKLLSLLKIREESDKIEFYHDENKLYTAVGLTKADSERIEECCKKIWHDCDGISTSIEAINKLYGNNRKELLYAMCEFFQHTGYMRAQKDFRDKEMRDKFSKCGDLSPKRDDTPGLDGIIGDLF